MTYIEDSSTEQIIDNLCEEIKNVADKVFHDSTHKTWLDILASEVLQDGDNNPFGKKVVQTEDQEDIVCDFYVEEHSVGEIVEVKMLLNTNCGLCGYELNYNVELKEFLLCRIEIQLFNEVWKYSFKGEKMWSNQGKTIRVSKFGFMPTLIEFGQYAMRRMEEFYG